jgi:hypothetical protein
MCGRYYALPVLLPAPAGHSLASIQARPAGRIPAGGFYFARPDANRGSR